MNSRIDSFERDGYIVEFLAEGCKLAMFINGLPVNNLRNHNKKAQLLSAWVTDVLGLPVSHKNSWKAIDDALTSYGYTLAPAYAQCRGKVLRSLYVITSSAPISVYGWPVKANMEA
jgi:hypothetical protein